MAFYHSDRKGANTKGYNWGLQATKINQLPTLEGGINVEHNAINI